MLGNNSYAWRTKDGWEMTFKEIDRLNRECVNSITEKIKKLRWEGKIKDTKESVNLMFKKSNKPSWYRENYNTGIPKLLWNEKMRTMHRTRGPLLSIFNGTLIDLACPSNLNIWWNIGSCLGLILVMQVVSGLFLTMHYSCDITTSFDSIVHIMRDVQYGWLLRYLHATGASFFFLIMYMHIGRSIYFSSFAAWKTFGVGLLLCFILIATAFVGYVLPWGQMSFWGATVITNLFSALPYVGKSLVVWLWGGFSVDSATLVRFYTFHFALPFLILGVSGLHIFFLHLDGSNNPLGLGTSADKVPFHWYFSIKDFVGFSVLLLCLLFLVFFEPQLLIECDNNIEANSLSTPSHIVPEWYFLFAYSILRSVNSALPGTGCLFLSLLLLLRLGPDLRCSMRSLSFYGPLKAFFWLHVSCFFLLTLGGSWPVALPFTKVTSSLSILYILYFLWMGLLKTFWERLLA